MGSGLFWKFFLVIWLALLTMGGGMGAVFWLQRNTVLNIEGDNNGITQIDVQYAAPFVNIASLILQKGGVDDLRSYLEESRNTPIPPVYVINEFGKDLLNREISPETIELTKSLAVSNPSVVRRIKTVDGQTYHLFAIFPEISPTTAHALPSPFETPPFEKPRHLHPDPPPPWLPIILGFFVSLIFSGVSAWYFAKPIRQLRSAFAAVAVGDLNTRADQTMGQRHDELADLGLSFDHMVNQIQTLVNAQQRLLHDVSHELRSPLARIQAAIGLAYQQPDKMPLTLERIEKEAQRMNDLIGELLALSRLEAGVIGKLEMIDINELITEIVEDARLEADSKNVSIKFITTEETFIKGYYDLISRAIENVLRNAIKHTKSSSTVSVSVSVSSNLSISDHQLHIVIIDQGPGVTETELAAIFQPFYRGSNSQKSQSTGLGLTIAQKAIEAHNGKISASNRIEGGFQVGIILPRS
jgi:two-component system, OmpR family, sensor kinase